MKNTLPTTNGVLSHVVWKIIFEYFTAYADPKEPRELTILDTEIDAAR